MYPFRVLIYTPDGVAYECLNGAGLWTAIDYARNASPASWPLPDVADPDAFPIGSVLFELSRDVLLWKKVEHGWVLGDEEPQHTIEVYSLKELEIIHQGSFRCGEAPEVSIVPFNALISDAEAGKIVHPEAPAFDGEFRDKESFMVRVQLPGYAQVRPKQRKLRRGGKPITRERLAWEVVDELRSVLGLSAVLLVGEQEMPTAELVLVDVRRVSRGSVQATLARRVV